MAMLKMPEIVPFAPVATPVLKWAGGKTSLLPELVRRMPAGWRRGEYYEPFIGGGALFFALAPTRATIGDINPRLTSMYGALQTDVEHVIRNLRGLEERHDVEQYARVRDALNLDSDSTPITFAAKRAAHLIYLNRTCFNGLYRENKSGAFNVPMGNYAKPAICRPKILRAAAKVLMPAAIVTGCYDEITCTATRGDFVYFDPPYDVLPTSDNFASYTKHAFGRTEQKELAQLFHDLVKRGVRCMLSNSDTRFVRGLYKGHRIHRVECARSINSDAGGRGAVHEVIVMGGY